MNFFSSYDMDLQEACTVIGAWVRRRFALGTDAPVLVCQLECQISGCPPVETACAYWRDGVRQQFKLLKPAVEVCEDDIAWLIAPDTADPEDGWTCC